MKKGLIDAAGVLLPEELRGARKVYIAGKISGDADYRAKFARVQTALVGEGYIPLSPSVLPDGMTTADYMRICFTMIDVADAVLFLPDRNLGRNVAEKVGREYKFWDGCCPIHDRITPEMILAAKAAHPGCPVIIHPECRPEVLKLPDYAASTGKMLTIVKNDPAEGFIIATEEGILHRMKKEFPDKKFYALSPCVICQDMKKITLESVRDALKLRQFEVKLDAEIIEKARQPIERMLNLK